MSRPTDCMRPHTSAYVSMHTYAYVSIHVGGTVLLDEPPDRLHTSAYVVSIRQHSSAFVSIRQHMPAYVVSIRQHSSAFVSIPRRQSGRRRAGARRSAAILAPAAPTPQRGCLVSNIQV
jgi:hypothetical protein